jgi:hypothetical protein
MGRRGEEEKRSNDVGGEAGNGNNRDSNNNGISMGGRCDCNCEIPHPRLRVASLVGS